MSAGAVRGVLPESIPVPVVGLVVRTWRECDVPEMAEAITASIEHLRPFMPWIAQEPLAVDARSAMVAGWESARRDDGDSVYGIWRDGRIVGGTVRTGEAPPMAWRSATGCAPTSRAPGP